MAELAAWRARGFEPDDERDEAPLILQADEAQRLRELEEGPPGSDRPGVWERMLLFYAALRSGACVRGLRRCFGACKEMSGAVLVLVVAVVLLIFLRQISAVILIISISLSLSLSLCLRAVMLSRARRMNAARNDQALAMLRSLNVNPTHLRLSMMDRDFNPEDYETLLRLDEEARHARPTGLRQSEIDRLPTFVASDATSSSTSQCMICLEAVKPGDSMRTVPCLHSFHKDCIDPWLRTKSTCPICNFRLDAAL